MSKYNRDQVVLPEVDQLINVKRDPKEETIIFNKAQQERDFPTMYDCLFHTACQFIKSKGHGKFWDIQKICDVANDISIAILDRYRRKPEYQCNHLKAVALAYRGIVWNDMKKQSDFEAKCCSYEMLMGQNA